MAIATIIYPVNEKDPFWSDAAKNLFVGLGLLVLETPELPKTIGEILRQGSGKGNSIETYLTHVLAVRAASPNPLSNSCRDALGRFLGSGETALKGIVATFSATLTPFANDVIDKATSGDDFDLRDVRKKKMTIYLHIPAGEILQATFIINLFFSQLINENVRELPEQNLDLKYQCLLLMDEFTAMGKVAIIAKGVGFMAGYNMRLAIIIQDKTQLDSVYGKEDAHNIVSNMGAVIYFTPSQVSEAEEYSKMIGNNTVLSDSMQHAKGTLFGLKGTGGDSRTESYQSRAVMLPQELLGMSKDTQLIVRPGIPVIKADKIRYYDDAFFKERFNAVPMHEVTIGDERRMVPVPARLPEGNWDTYRASLVPSDYYLRQPSPGAAPAMPVVAAAPSAASAPATGPAVAASVAAERQTDTEVGARLAAPATPELPIDFESFCSLHARLSAAPPPPPPPSRTAAMYAESIVRYWQMVELSGRIDNDVPLAIIDLAPADGQFAWQLINALRERLTTLPLQLPYFQYHACADNEQEQAALRAHPYLHDIAQEGILLTPLRNQLLAERGNALHANPVVVIAHHVLGRLKHELIATHYGEVFGVHALVTPGTAPNTTDLPLEYQWPALPLTELSPASAAIVELYRASLNSAVVSLPCGALDLLDTVRNMAGEQFLMISADCAIFDQREIGLGAFSPPTLIHFPAAVMPTNYHAVSAHLRAHGDNVWLEKMPDSELSICVALHDGDSLELDDEQADALADLVAPLAAAHDDEALRFAKLLRHAALPLSDCLALLQRAHYDPRILTEIFPLLQSADWQLATIEREQWQHALARTWAQYLPQGGTDRFDQKIITLAAQVGHFGLVRAGCRNAIAFHGENTAHLLQLAECELDVGDTPAAAIQLRKARAQQPQDPAVMAMQKELERRLNAERAHDWYRADQAHGGALRLEPLGSHHAAQLHHQYRDPQIGAMTMLPRLDTVEDMRNWIAAEQSEASYLSCAVMHESWGVTGFISVQRVDTDGYFTLWIGTDHQGHGYGVAAGTVMREMLQERGTKNLFTACFQDNQRASRVLSSIGFVPLDSVAQAPYQDLVFFHLGTGADSNQTHEQLDNVCRRLGIPFEFVALTDVIA